MAKLAKLAKFKSKDFPEDKEANLVLKALAALGDTRPVLRARVVGNRVEIWFLGGTSAVVWTRPSTTQGVTRRRLSVVEAQPSPSTESPSTTQGVTLRDPSTTQGVALRDTETGSKRPSTGRKKGGAQ